MNRRGFFGMLAGAFAALKVGPKVEAQPEVIKAQQWTGDLVNERFSRADHIHRVDTIEWAHVRPGPRRYRGEAIYYEGTQWK